ncbi:MAG TPA: hypothetical protein VGH73_05685 [Thermoanaerobaculia bacterium]|jgi:hypothetical protein
MNGSRVRRPLSWLVLPLLALLLPVAWGCDRLGSSHGGSGSASTSSEADRTRKLEDKAAEIDHKSEEVRNMEGSEQEKIDAMNSLDKDRRDASESQDQGGGDKQ